MKFLKKPKHLFVSLFLLVISIHSFSNTGIIGIDSVQPIIQFVFTSDVHFGLTKPTFRNQKNVAAAEVNAAMIKQINLLPSMNFPDDNGVSANHNINGIDAVIITGDIANRQENDVQSATDSWKQFEEDYLFQLHVSNKSGHKTTLLLTPGNHDISNAIGFHRPMKPLTDNASMRGMYNLMIQPVTPKTATNYNYPADKIHYSKDIEGVHLIFVDAWPDSAERVWMEKDLSKIKSTTPVFIFTHSMPDVEARFFKNPNGDHSINEKDKFENLVSETFKDGTSVEDNAIIEQKALANFIKIHPNIKAYFHGHSNYTEYYDWKGPDQNINLHCFRADSPMKGKYSAKDETKLAFEIITIDTSKKIMTVRECLWNAHPDNSLQPIEWGISRTLDLITNHILN